MFFWIVVPLETLAATTARECAQLPKNVLVPSLKYDRDVSEKQVSLRRGALFFERIAEHRRRGGIARGTPNDRPAAGSCRGRLVGRGDQLLRNLIIKWSIEA